MLTLYGAFRSRATRPLWLLYEAGVDFAHVPVVQAYRLADPAAADAPLNTASPDFLKVNPQGQVPAMVDDGLVLTESLAICLHIARKHGGLLGPLSLAEMALTDQWGFFAATGLETPGLAIYFAHAEGRAATDAGRAEIAAAAARLARPLDRLEGHLQGRDWLVADRFTVADVMVAECLRYATAEPGFLDRWPAVKAWLARCQARPAFQKMWAARNAEPM
jgi:glutathione S-transferase